MAVTAGQPVVFVVTNIGQLDHEFFVGDATRQAEHEAELRAGAPLSDGVDAVVVAPGQTEELTYTFAAAADFLAGCHVLNHYAGGMRATIVVSE
jgi:uncharacterized cupredoxin-like copper-binding protein